MYDAVRGWPQCPVCVQVAVLENCVAAVTAATSSARETPEQVAMKQVNQS